MIKKARIRYYSDRIRGSLGLTEEVKHKKYENKREGFQDYLKCLFNKIFRISLRSRYRAPDPVVCPKTGSETLHARRGETRN